MERFSFAFEVAFVLRGDTRWCDRRAAHPFPLRGSPFQAASFRFAPGGRLIGIPRGSRRSFAVLDESGEVSGADGLGEPIAADEAVYWIEGEEDEVESAVGLTALIIEGEHVERFRERPKAAP